MSEHTQGPHSIDRRDRRVVVRGGCSEVMAIIPVPEMDGCGVISGTERSANAQRIKAALNACRGIETETLENGRAVSVFDQHISVAIETARADAAKAAILAAQEHGWVLVTVATANEGMRADAAEALLQRVTSRLEIAREEMAFLCGEAGREADDSADEADIDAIKSARAHLAARAAPPVTPGNEGEG